MHRKSGLCIKKEGTLMISNETVLLYKDAQCFFCKNMIKSIAKWKILIQYTWREKNVNYISSFGFKKGTFSFIEYFAYSWYKGKCIFNYYFAPFMLFNLVYTSFI